MVEGGYSCGRKGGEIIYMYTHTHIYGAFQLNIIITSDKRWVELVGCFCDS